MQSRPPSSALGDDPRGSGRPRRRGGLVLPLALILVGVLILLRNVGLLPSEMWANAWRLWPLFLIALGLEPLLRRGGGPVSALGVLILVAIVVIAVAGPGFFPGFGDRGNGSGPSSSQVTGQSSNQGLQGARQADVSLQFGAGTLSVGALGDDSSDQVGQVSYSGRQNQAPTTSYTVDNGVGHLSYALRGSGGWLPWMPFGQDRGAQQVNVALTPRVPLTLSVQSGAADLTVDASRLLVSSLNVQIGASKADISLPAAAGTTTATVRGGAATVTLRIPTGVAAQIQQRGGLSTFQVDQGRFPQVGSGQYRSADYDTATDKVDLIVETGASTVIIE